MWRRSFQFFVLIATFLGMNSAHAGEEAAWFYTWRASTPTDFVEGFVKDHPEGLVVDTFMSSDEAEARLLSGETEYDLAMVPIEMVQRLASVEVLRPLKTRQSDTAPTGAEPLSAVPQAAAGWEKYYVPYIWGTTGLVIDVDAVRERLPNAPLDSWDLLFDPENAAALADCGISLPDAAQHVLSIALNHLGRDPNGISPEDLDAGFAALRQIMPHVINASPVQFEQMVAGEFCLGLVWSTAGVVPEFYGSRLNYRYIVPKEGSVIWSNGLIAPSNAESDAHSNALIDYLLSKDVAENTANYSLATLAPETFGLPASDTQRMIEGLTFTQRPHQNMYTLRSLTGAQKRELDKRWRRLLIGQ